MQLTQPDAASVPVQDRAVRDPLRVVVADDSVLLREGLIRLLAEDGHEVVAAVGDGTALVDAMRRHGPDVSVVDVRMPPTHTDEGLRAAVTARSRLPGAPILVLSQYVELSYASELLADGAGAVGYLLKERVARVEEFLDALDRVAHGAAVLDPEVIAQLLAGQRRDSALAALTARERQLLALMAQGHSNTAIAKQLVLSASAVEKHIGNVFAKLGLPPDESQHRRVLAVLPAPVRARHAATASDRTLTPAEAARLADRVPTPVLRWTTCRKTAQCATAEVPLNYHHPHGQAIKLALLRIKAKDPRHRLGTIFVNPGGPGDSARDFAFSATVPPALPKSILDRFDIVGVDPRGIGGSTQLRCFGANAERTRAEAPLKAIPFPVTPPEQRTWISSASQLGRACSTTGRSIAAAMSTTDDAIDLDVLRRAVGDRKLTYVGDSYGSYLGLVYANLFPGQVRAMVIDGIIDPQELIGTPDTANVPVFDRMGSAAASDRALRELLKRCQRAGRSECSFADADTQARFARLAARLRARSLRLAAPGIKATTFTYAEVVADTEHWLHAPSGYRGLMPELTDLARLTAPGGAGRHHATLVRALVRLHRAVQAGPTPAGQLEAESGILCADSPNAADTASWAAAAAAADRRARYFGAIYAWLSVQCARNTWTVRDQDVYRGPFDRRTAAPVLVIGNLWDPATSYASAVKVARLLPNSRLISSDSWGHTALLTSACVDSTTWHYLLHPLVAAPKITHCRGDVQPFAP